MSGQFFALAALPRGKKAGSRRVRSWAGPSTVLDSFWRTETLLPLSGFEPQTVVAIPTEEKAVNVRVLGWWNKAPAADLKTREIHKSVLRLLAYTSIAFIG
jgi:hypothetical protein